MTLNAEAALSSGSPQPFKLDHLSYTDSVVVKRMFQHLNEIDFLGISVSIITLMCQGLIQGVDGVASHLPLIYPSALWLGYQRVSRLSM